MKNERLRGIIVISIVPIVIMIIALLIYLFLGEYESIIKIIYYGGASLVLSIIGALILSFLKK